MSEETLSAGTQLSLEEGRPWSSRIIAVYDGISELRAEDHMVIMVENGVVLIVPRNARWASGANVEIRSAIFRRPGDPMTHRLLYPILPSDPSVE